MTDVTSEDRERVKLLTSISSSKHEFDKLSLEQLARLEELLKKKDYSHDKKADKTKTKFLKRINVRIYELTEGKGIWGQIMPISDKLTEQDLEKEKELVAEITKAMKDEGYTEEEVRQGLELAYHLRTNVKAKMDSLSDCRE